MSTTPEDNENLDEVYQSVHDFFIEDEVVLNVLRKYESRSKEGMQTYGVSLRENRMSLYFFLLNLQEELMDASLYIEKTLEQLDEGRECLKQAEKTGVVQTILKTMRNLVN